MRFDPRYRDVVHIIGHPYVDIWQAVKPHVVGIDQWPAVPRGEDWKTGILRRVGWPHADHRDVARGWARSLGKVTTIADVEPALSGRGEELIDFVTVGCVGGRRLSRSLPTMTTAVDDSARNHNTCGNVESPRTRKDAHDAESPAARRQPAATDAA